MNSCGVTQLGQLGKLDYASSKLILLYLMGLFLQRQILPGWVGEPGDHPLNLVSDSVFELLLLSNWKRRHISVLSVRKPRAMCLL